MKILVTGATGFVGRGIVAELLGRGHEVWTGSRSGAAVGVARGLTLDVTELGSVQRAFGEVMDLDAVIHLVGVIAERGGQTFRRVHVEGTRNLLSGVPRGARFLHLSALGADPPNPYP
ncbi:MAG: NAD-dependent epimerase/dehydratase family protein, partial [Deinococcus sp.]